MIKKYITSTKKLHLLYLQPKIVKDMPEKENNRFKVSSENTFTYYSPLSKTRHVNFNLELHLFNILLNLFRFPA